MAAEEILIRLSFFRTMIGCFKSKCEMLFREKPELESVAETGRVSIVWWQQHTKKVYLTVYSK